MAFLDLIATLRNPGDDGIPETIYDDLTSEFDLAVTGGNAAISERDKIITDLNSEITRLKAINFDLLMATGAADEPVDAVVAEDEEVVITPEDLFTK